MNEALQPLNLSVAAPTRSMAEPPPRYSMMIHSLVPCRGTTGQVKHAATTRLTV